MTVRVRIDTAVLDRIIAQAPGRASEIVRSGATALQGRAMTLAPVDTGALKNSIHTEPKGALTQWVADGVEYGIFQEYGTSRMAAHPFMTPAAMWVLPRYLAEWKRLFEVMA